MFLGGRGAGKTRAGAEWVRSLVQSCSGPPIRIALVAETYHDARSVMVEGPSGILSVGPPCERPVFRASLRQVEWPNGSIAQLFSSEDPEGLRGPQFNYAWSDELAKWRYADETWTMLQFGLRLGDDPCQLVTTTPKPIALLKRLMADPLTVLTHATTYDNRANLAESFFKQVISIYEESDLGRQELLGEVIDAASGGLFRRVDIERQRIKVTPPLHRIVVAVDPPVTSGPLADECGIIIAGTGVDGLGYVLADLSCQGLSPRSWAEKVVCAYHDYDADRVVVEVNQGGELVTTLLEQVDPSVPIRQVRARRGKALRAEPVAALYEQGRICHVGLHATLEDQMVSFEYGSSQVKSPDRLDALVWALTDLFLRRKAPLPRSRQL